MQDTPKGLRKHIAILGRRNAGKSTLINALARQTVSIVSDEAGTTTDPVEKTMELSPMGPVVFIDTAGMDDVGELGRQRIERTQAIQGRSDLAILVTDGENWGEAEAGLLADLLEQGLPFLIVRNKSESGLMPKEDWRKKIALPGPIPIIDISARNKKGLDALVKALAELGQGDDSDKPLLADLVSHTGVVLLIVPLDTGAPKGRLILPQVMAIRDCLDAQQICIVCTEKQAESAINRMRPDLVICDSQVAKIANEITPRNVPFTTFSILMARNKGNLEELAKGAGALEQLRPGDVVLIEEACSHHAQKDDIGQVKIPALLKKRVGGDLEIRHHQGKELAKYPTDIKVIVHCGACVITPGQMRARQGNAQRSGIPMTNYGMAITLCQGILERTLEPFPEALASWKKARAETSA